MSRPIQVRISESVVRTIHVEDGVQSPLEILPVLGADRMAELLASELEKLGFEREGTTARRTDSDGIEVSVDLAAATVSVKLGAGAKLAEKTHRTGYAGSEDRMRADAADELEQRLAAQTEALRREVTAQLERKLADLRKELDGAVGRATVAALTERAAQLGKIEEVLADDAGNVTIKVKL